MLTPTHDYRRLDYRVPPRVLAGLDAMVNRGVGIYQRRAQRVAKLREDAERIVHDEARWRELPDASLHERLMEFRGTFRRGGKLADEIVLGALGAIREASRRELGLHPFPVQLMGALALHRGFLAEMATGEGKTLTAGLAAVLAGWTELQQYLERGFTAFKHMKGADDFMNAIIGRETRILDAIFANEAEPFGRMRDEG